MFLISRIFLVLFVALFLSACQSMPPVQDGMARIVIIRDSDSNTSKIPPILKVDINDKTLDLNAGEYAWIDVMPGKQQMFWKVVWPNQPQNDTPGSRQCLMLAKNEIKYLEASKLSSGGHIKGWMIKWLNEDRDAFNMISDSRQTEWKTQTPWPWRN